MGCKALWLRGTTIRVQMDVSDGDFDVDGTGCAATLYTPDDVSVGDGGVVVMAHGFGGTRGMRLPEYAEWFVDRGLSALAFDYRGWGDSGGRPREVLRPRRQLEDWRAAVEHVRGLGYSSVGLWGTSLSGGHVVAVAADVEVDAVVSQVPFADGLANVLHAVRENGVGYGLRAGAAAIEDLGRRLATGGRRYVPVVRPRDEFSALRGGSAWEGYLEIAGEADGWSNRVAAGVLLSLAGYRPVERAADVTAPVLVVQATEDDLIPQGSVDRLVERLPDVEVLPLDVGHFDVYTGDEFEHVVEEEASFLEDQLS